MPLQSSRNKNSGIGSYACKRGFFRGTNSDSKLFVRLPKAHREGHAASRAGNIQTAVQRRGVVPIIRHRWYPELLNKTDLILIQRQ